MTTRRGGIWPPILVAALAALVIGALGAAATDTGPWYRHLVMPAWKPPDWLFGPAWTLIYALIALAGYLAWRGGAAPPGRPARQRMLAVFGLNACLNLLWSTLFFTLHRPDWALAEVVALWLSIVAMIVVARRTSHMAGWLLLPYLGWVSFAAWLNLAVVRLNAPF